MKNQTSYLDKRAGLFVPTLLITLLVYALTTLNSFAQSYSGPLVITKGGTYSGNWESRDSEVPAIEIRTNEPVVIVNSNLRGAGALIRSLGNSADITVRHTKGYGITPTPWKNYMKPRRFLAVDVFRNIVVENCYMEGTAGIYIGQRYEGNGSTGNTIKIRYNKAKNIDGRVYGGGKALVQFVQFNFKTGAPHVEVAWNEVINEPGNSAVEDNINMHNSRGTSSSPIRIHNNYIQGAYPIPQNNTRYTGGGIITDGDGDINSCPAYITASENQLVNLGNYSMGIAGGNNIRYTNNRAINSATFKDGTKFAFYTSGLWSTDYYKKNTTFSNSIDNNVVGVTAWGGYVNNRNDISVAQFASYVSNTFLPGSITNQNESAEYTRWTQKLQQNGISLGPNGSAATPAPANQAPTVAIASPRNGSSLTQGTSITLTANAADADGRVTKVEYFHGNTKIGESTSTPYSYAWSNASVGNYTLTAKATDDEGATTTSDAVRIEVTAPTASTPTQQPTAAAGTITREYWDNIRGTEINRIPLSEKPTSVTALTSFEAPTNIAHNYGQRVRGYITAPTTGNYTFWLSGDDRTELYLSTSENPSDKKLIAYSNVWTLPRQWNKTSSQKSSNIRLEAGKRYYIEALMKQEGGGDNLAVGWTLPNGSQERPIAGNRLSPMGSKGTTTTPTTETPSVPTAPITPIASGSTGKITREYWANISGNQVSKIPVNTKPTSVTELSSFEAPTNIGDNYGQRVRGYVTAPTNGEYTFWIAGDNDFELWLSTSEDPNRKQRIAYKHSSWTNAREWDKYASQKSAKIRLEAGKRYYIEALMKEEAGGDNLAVGWQLPNGAMERPIQGNRLSPMTLESMQAATIADTETEGVNLGFNMVTAYPNPFKDVVVLNFGTEEVEVQQVVIMDQSGREVYKETKNLELVGNELKINLADANLRSGLYILKYVDSDGNSKSIKIVKQ